MECRRTSARPVLPVGRQGRHRRQGRQDGKDGRTARTVQMARMVRCRSGDRGRPRCTQQPLTASKLVGNTPRGNLRVSVRRARSFLGAKATLRSKRRPVRGRTIKVDLATRRVGRTTTLIVDQVQEGRQVLHRPQRARAERRASLFGRPAGTRWRGRPRLAAAPSNPEDIMTVTVVDAVRLAHCALAPHVRRAAHDVVHRCRDVDDIGFLHRCWPRGSTGRRSSPAAVEGTSGWCRCQSRTTAEHGSRAESCGRRDASTVRSCDGKAEAASV